MLKRGKIGVIMTLSKGPQKPLIQIRYFLTTNLQIPPQLLLAFDGFEERLEVAFAEGACAAALDDLEEKRRAVLHRLRENLEHVAIVIAIDEYPQPFQFLDRLIDCANPILQLAIIGTRHAQKFHTLIRKLGHGFDDIPRGKRNVLHAGPLYHSIYSSIWDFLRPVAGSLIGNFIFSEPDATTFDISAEYSVEISLSSKETKR